MKPLIKIAFFFTFCYLLIGCGSKKQTTTAATKTTATAVTTNKIKEVVTTNTQHFGDTLKGILPLPVLTKEPVTLVVETGGQKLELDVTDTSITYKSTPKHIATTTIHSVKETDTKAVADVVQVKATKTVTTKKPWRPPWVLISIIIVVVVVIVVAYYLKPIKTFLKPFKIFSK